jgi:hypothetical protein
MLNDSLKIRKAEWHEEVGEIFAGIRCSPGISKERNWWRPTCMGVKACECQREKVYTEASEMGAQVVITFDGL